jgi:hypothetical protein
MLLYCRTSKLSGAVLRRLLRATLDSTWHEMSVLFDGAMPVDMAMRSEDERMSRYLTIVVDAPCT